jgi:hypothetical protein
MAYKFSIHELGFVICKRKQAVLKVTTEDVISFDTIALFTNR